VTGIRLRRQLHDAKLHVEKRNFATCNLQPATFVDNPNLRFNAIQPVFRTKNQAQRTCDLNLRFNVFKPSTTNEAPRTAHLRFPATRDPAT
jgi:hypothetical protein